MKGKQNKNRIEIILEIRVSYASVSCLFVCYRRIISLLPVAAIGTWRRPTPAQPHSNNANGEWCRSSTAARMSIDR